MKTKPEIKAVYNATTKRYELTCAMCGAPFTARTYRALFCSDKCRQVNHRTWQRIERYQRHIESILGEWFTLAQKHPTYRPLLWKQVRAVERQVALLRTAFITSDFKDKLPNTQKHLLSVQGVTAHTEQYDTPESVEGKMQQLHGVINQLSKQLDKK